MASPQNVEDITQQLGGIGLSTRYFNDSEEATKQASLSFDPRNYTQKENLEELRQFVENCSPSKIKRSYGIGCIIVLPCNYENERLWDLDGLLAEWEKLQKSGKKINSAATKELAKTYGCLGGIWLLYFKTGDELDRAWETIARATAKGELGTYAKVTPFEDHGEGAKRFPNSHSISVYTKDCTDREDVMRVEAELRKLGVTKDLRFKPRVHTILGIYKGNQWGIRPSLYYSRWDKGRREPIIYEYNKV